MSTHKLQLHILHLASVWERGHGRSHLTPHNTTVYYRHVTDLNGHLSVVTSDHDSSVSSLTHARPLECCYDRGSSVCGPLICPSNPPGTNQPSNQHRWPWHTQCMYVCMRVWMNQACAPWRQKSTVTSHLGIHDFEIGGILDHSTATLNPI